MDEKIPEPLGAAHTDPMAAFPAIKDAIMRNYRRWGEAACSCFNLLVGWVCWAELVVGFRA